MTPKEKAKIILSRYEILDGFNEYQYLLVKKCAEICISNEYFEKREQLIHFKGSGVIKDEKLYLKYLDKIIQEEINVKNELEKL